MFCYIIIDSDAPKMQQEHFDWDSNFLFGLKKFRRAETVDF